MKRINKRTALLSSGDLLSTENGMNIFFQICNHIDIRVCILTHRLILDTFTTNRLNIDDAKILFDSDK